MIAIRVFKPVAILVSALLIATGLVALSAAPKAEAANAAQFDPGNIISDSVFYDFGTMDVNEIQRFLNSKLPTCNDNDGGPKCIRDFISDTPAMTGESGRCESLPAQQNQTAAQIIFTIANACKINPRVLIVTLQKEQGLIQENVRLCPWYELPRYCRLRQVFCWVFLPNVQRSRTTAMVRRP